MNSQINTTNIPDNPTPVKPAAIFARVSTAGQAETSLPDQVSRCQDKLKEAGYSAIHVFQVDWSSMDLYSCPEFQELQSLISSKEVQALAVYERDRLSAKPIQRLVFLSELKEQGVELITCYGPPVIEGSEGVLLEHVHAIAKEKQVLRASQGAKDGMRHRVKTGKPAEYHRLYGYKWDEENNVKINRLLPDDNWPNLKLMFDMLLEGYSYRAIAKEFAKRGILTTTGNTDWNPGVISQVAHNPTYAGRYFGIKHRGVSLDEALYVPSIEIVNPPITWEQRGQMLEQIERNALLATRNAKRAYMLRGRVFCAQHLGKRGEPLLYQGKASNKGKWYYRCQVGGCRSPHLNGQNLELEVITRLYLGFTMTDDQFYKMIGSKDARRKNKQTLEKELKGLELEYERLINNAAQLEDDRISGKVTDIETYERLKLRYQARRQAIKERQDETLSEIAQLDRSAEAIESFKNLRNKFLQRIEDWCAHNHPKLYEAALNHPAFKKFDKEHGAPEPPESQAPLTDREWQQIFAALDLKLYIHSPETALPVADSIGAWAINDRARQNSGGKDEMGRMVLVEVRMALPLTDNAEIKKAIGDIALVEPHLRKLNSTYYPIRLPHNDFPTIASIMGEVK